MRKALLVIAIALMAGWAAPAEACEECADYFDYQTETWCMYCEREVDCGYFNCRIEQSWFGDYCTGDDGGCFTNRSSDYCGPDEDSSLPAQPLDGRWKLKGVRVTRPAAVATAG